MEERSAPVELPVSNSEVKKSGENECGDKNPRYDTSDVSMPICFLVKEQAKSLIAIQDLQKRVESIETIQDDVIDSLADIRKFLCSDSKTFSDLTIESPSNASNHLPSTFPITKSESFSKSFQLTYSPVNFKDTKSTSSKECGPRKSSSSAQISVHSEKQFESKNKESALESDKQDSGLDSDCREIHDHFSLNKPSVNWVKPESGDELLLLLDEISQKTEILQNQLVVIDRKSCLDDDLHSEFSVLPAKQLEKIESLAQHQGSVKTPTNCLNCSGRVPITIPENYMEEAEAKKIPNDESPEHFEGKSLSDRVHRIQKRAANKIDSAMVSSILKETSVVDLQRQVLIYLVENAVLHTKLGELEQLLSSKTLESNKVENSLKDETRLLMMENRELRISLDEQKLETNSLRSKVLMLERVLQSITLENRELTWQLGESLGVHNVSRKEPHKFTTPFMFNNPTNSKLSRKSSLPSHFSQSETNVNCVKSKLLSNASSYLDITVEEPEQHWSEVRAPGMTYENHGGPVQSSTPVSNYTKLKDVKASVSKSTPGASNYQSVKKRFKPIEKDSVLFKNRNLDKHLDETPQDTENCVKTVKFNSTNFEDTAAKFPFNTILEKLKANSDYRVSRRTSLTKTNQVNFSGDRIKSAPFNKGRLTTSEDEENVLPNDGPRQNCQSRNFQTRKGKNIHQRIQDILDRIMSESV